MAVPILESPTLQPATPGRLRGSEFRLGQVRHVLDYLPPMLLQSLDEWGRATSPETPICGRCFRTLKDDPFDGKPGQLRPLKIGNQRYCFRCGRKCHPVD